MSLKIKETKKKNFSKAKILADELTLNDIMKMSANDLESYYTKEGLHFIYNNIKDIAGEKPKIGKRTSIYNTIDLIGKKQKELRKRTNKETFERLKDVKINIMNVPVEDLPRVELTGIPPIQPTTTTNTAKMIESRSELMKKLKHVSKEKLYNIYENMTPFVAKEDPEGLSINDIKNLILTEYIVYVSNAKNKVGFDEFISYYDNYNRKLFDDDQFLEESDLAHDQPKKGDETSTISRIKQEEIQAKRLKDIAEKKERKKLSKILKEVPTGVTNVVAPIPPSPGVIAMEQKQESQMDKRKINALIKAQQKIRYTAPHLYDESAHKDLEQRKAELKLQNLQDEESKVMKKIGKMTTNELRDEFPHIFDPSFRTNVPLTAAERSAKNIQISQMEQISKPKRKYTKKKVSKAKKNGAKVITTKKTYRRKNVM